MISERPGIATSHFFITLLSPVAYLFFISHVGNFHTRKAPTLRGITPMQNTFILPWEWIMSVGLSTLDDVRELVEMSPRRTD